MLYFQSQIPIVVYLALPDIMVMMKIRTDI